MKVSLRTRGHRDEGLVEFVNERAIIALGRFSGQIGEVTVRLEDLNGPKGGVDKRCTIEAIGKFGSRVVDARDDNFRASIGRAFTTLQRSIIRAMKRSTATVRAPGF